MARLFVFCFLCVWGGHVSFASDENPDHLRIPDEFEAIGGHALGLGHGGMAAISGLSSIRANPAMLAMTKQYSVVGGYHWPTYGRNFYQVGVVDSNTSNLAAGLIYNGFMDGPEDSFEGLDRQFDSPVKSRISLGFAGTSQLLAFGVSGSFVTAVSTEGSELKETKGLTLGLGVVGLLTPAIRFGLSAENLNNKEVAFVAPRTYRAALAYTLERVTLHLDWKRRDRVDGFELEPELSYFSLAGPGNQAPDLKNFEDLATASFSVQIYDLLRVVGAYAQSIGEQERREMATGGLALVQKGFSLSYNLARPYLAQPEVHSNININLGIAL